MIIDAPCTLQGIARSKYIINSPCFGLYLAEIQARDVPVTGAEVKSRVQKSPSRGAFIQHSIAKF